MEFLDMDESETNPTVNLQEKFFKQYYLLAAMHKMATAWQTAKGTTLANAWNKINDVYYEEEIVIMQGENDEWMNIDNGDPGYGELDEEEISEMIFGGETEEPDEPGEIIEEGPDIFFEECDFVTTDADQVQDPLEIEEEAEITHN